MARMIGKGGVILTGGENLEGNNPQNQGGDPVRSALSRPPGNINKGSTKTDGGNIHTLKNESGDANINTGEKGKTVSIIKQDGDNEGGENSGGNNSQIQGGNYGTIVFGLESNINEGSTKTNGDNSHTEKKDSIRSSNVPGHNKGGKNKGGINLQIQGGNHGTLAFRPEGNINEDSTKTDGGNIRTGKNESGGGNINEKKK